MTLGKLELKIYITVIAEIVVFAFHVYLKLFTFVVIPYFILVLNLKSHFKMKF